MADLQILIPCFECGLLIFEEGDWTWACKPDSNGLGAVRYYHDYGECAAKRKEAIEPIGGERDEKTAQDVLADETPQAPD